MHISNNLETAVLKCFEFCDCDIGDLGMISFSSVLPKTSIIGIGAGGNNLSSRGLEALADAIMKTTNFSVVHLFTRYPSKVIPGRVVQHFLKQLVYHPVFCKIIINDRIYDMEFKKFAEDFNKQREELGLNRIIIDHFNNESYDRTYEPKVMT